MNDLDLTAQVARLKARDVSARELVEASIVRAEALEPKLNALITRRFEQALVEAEKADPETPFAGAPFMHKDLVDVPGFARSDGAHAALHQQPERAPSLIGALQKAGLTFTQSFGLSPKPTIWLNCSKLTRACSTSPVAKSA